MIYATLASEVSNRKAWRCRFQGSKATFATAMVMAEVIIRAPHHSPCTLPRVLIVAYGAYRRML
ncbi:MAG: hypothetical protein SNG79_07040 [Rikenellaceae bacterium]